jgi:PadR family transcriptional regulator, regulatory protein PadR
MMSQDPLDLLRGTLDLLILRALAWQTMHGYGISAWLRQRTDGALAVQDAALYQALRRLERKGWVEAEWGLSENNRRARYYALTPRGREQLRAETAAWSRYADAVLKVLEPAAGEAR